jgi:hypothetical protein
MYGQNCGGINPFPTAHPSKPLGSMSAVGRLYTYAYRLAPFAAPTRACLTHNAQRCREFVRRWRRAAPDLPQTPPRMRRNSNSPSLGACCGGVVEVALATDSNLLRRITLECPECQRRRYCLASLRSENETQPSAPLRAGLRWPRTLFARLWLFSVNSRQFACHRSCVSLAAPAASPGRRSLPCHVSNLVVRLVAKHASLNVPTA